MKRKKVHTKTEPVKKKLKQESKDEDAMLQSRPSEDIEMRENVEEKNVTNITNSQKSENDTPIRGLIKEKKQLSPDTESPIPRLRKKTKKNESPDSESPIVGLMRKKVKLESSSHQKKKNLFPAKELQLRPEVSKGRHFTVKENDFLEDLYKNKTGYTRSTEVLTRFLSDKFGYLCNSMDKVKNWMTNRHFDSSKIRAEKHQREKTQVIFCPKINTKTPLIYYVPGCWGCDYPVEYPRTIKCTSCKYIFHEECVHNVTYENLELKTLLSCNFCENAPQDAPTL